MTTVEHNLSDPQLYTGTEQTVVANGQNLSIPGIVSITLSTQQNKPFTLSNV